VLQSVTVVNKDTQKQENLPGEAVFVFIGAVPRTEFIREKIVCDNAGFVFTGLDLMQDGKRPKGWSLPRDPFIFETSVPGIFAVGDVRHGSVKRVAAAIGEGSASLQSIHRYLSTV
jgi:thioredoxin reductase (NADPH)